MPIIDRNKIKRFPHKGSFYRLVIDTSLPPSQQTEGNEKKEYIIQDVDCHVMESHVSQVGGFNQASYKIFMEFDLLTEGGYFSEDNTPIRSGIIFESNLYGLLVVGEVLPPIPSQLGYCVLYIKDVNS